MKRDLFSELNEGFDAIKKHQKGKLTLKSQIVKKTSAPLLKSEEIIVLRENLNLSQAVFANYLRINKRTLENWEQGRAKPNAQAATLIKMVQKYPDTIKRLDNI